MTEEKNTYYGDGVILTAGFDLHAAAPLDYRTLFTDWTNASLSEVPADVLFVGLLASDETDKKVKILKIKPANASTAADCTWEEVGKVLSEGTNIDITNNTISALGYTWDETLKSFAEGNSTASGNGSHAEGIGVLAQNASEHAEGSWNTSHKADTTYGNAGNTQHSIGIGSQGANKNAFEIMQNGDTYLYGVGNYNGTTIKASGNNIQTLQDVLGTIPAALVNADWNASSGAAEILNKPTIPTVGDGSLYIKVDQSGSETTVIDFGANQSDNDNITFVAGSNITLTPNITNKTITIDASTSGGTITRVKTTAGAHTAIDVSSGAANFNVPTKTSHLTNDSGFLTSHQSLANIVASSSSSTTEVTSATNNPYVNLLGGGAVKDSIQMVGGTGISVSGTAGTVTINHSNSVTSGTASEGGSTRTLAYGGTFNVPSVTYDSYGHITGNGSVTLTLPASDNTDTKVKQTLGTTDATYPILASAQTSPTSGTAYEAIYDSGIVINPNKHSVAEGVNIIASGRYSHAEGTSYITKTISVRKLTGAEINTIRESTGNTYTYVEVNNAISIGYVGDIYVNSGTTKLATITESRELTLDGSGVDVFNVSLETGQSLTSSDTETTTYKFIEKPNNNVGATGDYSHAEGWCTTASSNYSHVEGSLSTASQSSAHAEGHHTTASESASHAEGNGTTASGTASHAEGYHTTASSNYSHAEGYYNTASKIAAHAEGRYCYAEGIASHAEGGDPTSELVTRANVASGDASHVEGYYTTANNDYEHAQGKFNKSNTSVTTASGATNTIHSIGIGTSTTRSNAVEVMANGDVFIKGIGGYDGTNPNTTNRLQDAIGASGNYLPLSGGTMEGTITIPGEDEFKLEFTSNGYTNYIGACYQTLPGQEEDNNLEIDGDSNVIVKIPLYTNNICPTRHAVCNIGNTDYRYLNLYTTNAYSTNGFFQSSDSRKKDIVSEIPLDKAYELVEKCQTILYTWKDDEEKKIQLGVLAQEVKEYFPELVSQDENGYYSVDYTKLSVLLMRVIRDLTKRVEKLESLEARIAAIENK